MSELKVAHLHRQGQDMIIVPLRCEPTDAQIDTIQFGANDAGLRGTVVPVWLSGGRMRFIAPQPWHPFFRSLSWNAVLANLNRKLTFRD